MHHFYLLFVSLACCMFLFECTCKRAVLVFWWQTSHVRNWNLTKCFWTIQNVPIPADLKAKETFISTDFMCNQSSTNSSVSTVHALMFVRLDHGCNLGLLLSVPLKLLKTVIKADSRHFVHSTDNSLCLCSAAAAQTFAPSSFLWGAGITMTPDFCFLVNWLQSNWVQRSASTPSRPRGCRWTCGLNQRPCTNCAHTFLRRAKMSSHFGTVQLK